MKKVIFIKGFYDCNGGVQEMEVSRTTYMLGVLECITDDIIFVGDIKNISETDDLNEIDTYLKDRFKEEDFVIKLMVK